MKKLVVFTVTGLRNLTFHSYKFERVVSNRLVRLQELDWRNNVDISVGLF
jgi:hypothetical protein